MNPYINKNLSFVNKFNNIIIKLGVQLSKNILNCKINKQQLTIFLKRLHVNYSIKPIYSNIHIYYRNNSINEIKNKTNSNMYTYKPNNIQNYKYKNISMYIYINKLLINENNSVSIYHYDNIEKIQKVLINISNSIYLEIKNSIHNNSQYYTINIVIKKSYDSNNIIKDVNNIVKYFNESITTTK